mgnify:CR=1 FL=1
MLKFIKNNLDKVRDQFEEGGKFQRFYPLFVATDTILFSTDEKTNSGPHIRDSIDTIKGSGIRTIIQPGGSIRDQEVIDACNEHGFSMVFTGTRCFKH